MMRVIGHKRLKQLNAYEDSCNNSRDIWRTLTVIKNCAFQTPLLESQNVFGVGTVIEILNKQLEKM